MPDKKKKRKRSRSRSRSRDRRRDEDFKKLKEQVDNLTRVVELSLTHAPRERSVIDKIDDNPESISSGDDKNKENEPPEGSSKTSGDKNIQAAVENPGAQNEAAKTKSSTTEVSGGENIEEACEDSPMRENVLKVLGVDLNQSKFKKIEYHEELKNTWSQWIKRGLPEKNKKEILETYNRKTDLYLEAPKINLEIVPLLSEIAKKRDEHFVETQNCVGTALAALGAAVSMLIDPPENGLDEEIFTDFLSHAGQLLSDVFYQQSVARKSFITPQLSKSIKLTVDAMISDEWLYGNNLKDKVKEAKEIEKACAEIKEKPQIKSNTQFRSQGNSKYPLPNNTRVGHRPQPKHKTFHFKKRQAYQTPQSTTKSTTQTTNQSSSKK